MEYLINDNADKYEDEKLLMKLLERYRLADKKQREDIRNFINNQIKDEDFRGFYQ
jgi:regulatory protein YycI of two-component signal transduction system YycFG